MGNATLKIFISGVSSRILMQRQLYIAEAHTALDIFGLAAFFDKSLSSINTRHKVALTLIFVLVYKTNYKEFSV